MNIQALINDKVSEALTAAGAPAGSQLLYVNLQSLSLVTTKQTA
ncbi:hypothetical protein JCM19232_5615 [Vibrio ishigakensis]|uniref:Uncharacterized protein n=1 Tax=Vibrio ishigakensis TaxID=1481914 RepID=A0A0B8PEQ6_9VIBR|nr:hypothetical protein JCM19232_5615 [Vibrio ishigakensis]